MPTIGEVKITHPLEGVTVTVRVTLTGWLRLWATRTLLWLAVWVSGGNLVIEEPHHILKEPARITIDVPAAFEAYAISLGKTVAGLTPKEQQDATVHAVLVAGQAYNEASQ
jgi:hypothetical protein